MVGPKLQSTSLTTLLDTVIKAVLVLIVLVLICGGFDLSLGSVDLSIHQKRPLLLGLVIMFLIRWLVARSGPDAPFALSTRWQWFFRRLLEIGIVVHVVMFPVVWRWGEFRSPVFESPDLGYSLGVICLFLLVRFIMGRNLAGLTVMLTTGICLTLVLYGLEFVLRTSEASQLREMTAEVEVVASAPDSVAQPTVAGDRAPAGRATAETPVDAAFDPTRNDGKNWTWGHEVVYNRFGYREKEFAVPKPDGLFRIMILGDSLTWGAGLAPHQRYTAVLEKMFAQANPGQAIEVLNFGLPGGPTVVERDSLAQLHEEVEPDLIVVGFCLNDPQPRSMNYSRERTNLHRLYNLIADLRHIGLEQTYAFLINRINTLFVNLKVIPSWQDALDRTYQPGSEEWQAFEEALADIKRIADQRGATPPVFILLTQNIARDKPRPPYVSRWFAQAGDAAQKRGFVVVDPAPSFIAELYSNDLPVNPRDGHPSAACNLIYARELFETLQPMVRRAGDG